MVPILSKTTLNTGFRAYFYAKGIALTMFELFVELSLLFTKGKLEKPNYHF